MRDAGHRTPDAGHRTAKKAKIIYPPPRGVDIISGILSQLPDLTTQITEQPQQLYTITTTAPPQQQQPPQ